LIGSEFHQRSFGSFLSSITVFGNKLQHNSSEQHIQVKKYLTIKSTKKVLNINFV